MLGDRDETGAHASRLFGANGKRLFVADHKEILQILQEVEELLAVEETIKQLQH